MEKIMLEDFIGADGMIHTIKPISNDNSGELKRKEPQEIIDVCLNCKSSKCNGNCKKYYKQKKILKHIDKI